MPDEAAYRVETTDVGFEVRSEDGRVVMTCHDLGSAQHYTAMLNAAFVAGFKQGYRQGRSEQ